MSILGNLQAVCIRDLRHRHQSALEVGIELIIVQRGQVSCRLLVRCAYAMWHQDIVGFHVQLVTDALANTFGQRTIDTDKIECQDQRGWAIARLYHKALAYSSESLPLDGAVLPP